MALIKPAAYLQLLETGKYSDLVIDCQGVEFNVHRTVVCPQSAMLDAACSGKFEEAHTGRIKFPEQHPYIMARAILFMYTADHLLPDFLIKKITQDQKDALGEIFSYTFREIDELDMRRLKVNALLYGCADMLGIEDLKTIASELFMEVAALAFEYDGFEEPLQLLYENTRPDDCDLRLKVTGLCVENHDLLETRTKTLEVLQDHEPNVWHVSVELFKRWTSSQQGQSMEKLPLRNRGRLSKTTMK
ncbi:hypothetical protein A1O3_07095 [Capronia epimyces CBS 606.96]|uniref:BTB domain-containing protein n=1 Tax=Capronia epimyces CBS 606.96 TaxID=1182542 RepID=W9XUY0_9EURO|nr:uncharacterized protein A1O3_07095 [Capronia epimyces CBS 606.96]EXJ80811.1 hypothetical protein A1O3_07095 [Capronia epimyces CBS 606.96]